MRVKQDSLGLVHRSLSQASGSRPTMSPTIFTVPFKYPNIGLRLCSSTGTIFTIGLPRLETMTGFRLLRTSSITLRQVALNSVADNSEGLAPIWSSPADHFTRCHENGAGLRPAP